MRNIINYLQSKVNPDGSASYDCFNNQIKNSYYSSVTWEALVHAKEIGIYVKDEIMDSIKSFVLSMQKNTGSFIYEKNRFLGMADILDYPRHLSYILRSLCSISIMSDH